jgi:hypothetical protein
MATTARIEGSCRMRQELTSSREPPETKATRVTEPTACGSFRDAPRFRRAVAAARVAATPRDRFLPWRASPRRRASLHRASTTDRDVGIEQQGDDPDDEAPDRTVSWEV